MNMGVWDWSSVGGIYVHVGEGRGWGKEFRGRRMTEMGVE